MPGKKIMDHQVRKYKQERKTLTQVAAAARAGISERSARRIDETDALPSQREARSWRTREDPLSEVWDAKVVPLLQTDVTDSVGIAPTEPTVKVKGPPPGSPCPLNLIPQCLVGPPRVEVGTKGS